MTDRTLKNLRRRQESQLTRKNRVLVGYIEKIHPQVHAEAFQYYEELNNKYPGKIDLRRTVEYEMMYNNMTKRRRYDTRKSEPKKIGIQNNMILTIPLIPQSKLEKTPQSKLEKIPQSEPEKMPQSEPEKMPQSEPEKMPQSEPEKMPQSEPEKMPEPENMQFPIITEEAMQEIISELQEDNPHFSQWFEDIDLDIDIDIDNIF